MTSNWHTFYGNTSFIAKLTHGSGVTTTVTAYGQGSLGWGFDGANTSRVGLSVGSQHFSVALDFDAAADFHEYSFTWSPAQVDFLVDGKLIFSATDDIPQQPMPFWVFYYACGASCML